MLPRYGLDFDISVALGLLALFVLAGVAVLFSGSIRRWWEDRKAEKYRYQRVAQIRAVMQARHSEPKDAA